MCAHDKEFYYYDTLLTLQDNFAWCPTKNTHFKTQSFVHELFFLFQVLCKYNSRVDSLSNLRIELGKWEMKLNDGGMFFYPLQS